MEKKNQQNINHLRVKKNQFLKEENSQTKPTVHSALHTKKEKGEFEYVQILLSSYLEASYVPA